MKKRAWRGGGREKSDIPRKLTIVRAKKEDERGKNYSYQERGGTCRQVGFPMCMKPNSREIGELNQEKECIILHKETETGAKKEANGKIPLTPYREGGRNRPVKALRKEFRQDKSHVEEEPRKGTDLCISRGKKKEIRRPS